MKKHSIVEVFAASGCTEMLVAEKVAEDWTTGQIVKYIKDLAEEFPEAKEGLEETIRKVYEIQAGNREKILNRIVRALEESNRLKERELSLLEDIYRLKKEELNR